MESISMLYPGVNLELIMQKVVRKIGRKNCLTACFWAEIVLFRSSVKKFFRLSLPARFVPNYRKDSSTFCLAGAAMLF